MLLGFALILSLGMILGELFRKMKLPGFVGMILTGIVLGPYALDLIGEEILSISSELRQIALVVILLRAGLSLDIEDLKKVGHKAILISFISASFEILAVFLLGPILFDITYLEAAILGSVLAAVSPAVVVPKMIKLMDQGYGQNKRIPQLLMASASVDDIYVIVLFTAFIQMYQTGNLSLSGIAQIPVVVITGIVVGVALGALLAAFFRFFRVRDTIKVLIILGVSIFLVVFEKHIQSLIPFSALLSIVVVGITFLHQSEERALRLRLKFSKVWVFVELILFVLVGAAVDISVVLNAGAIAIVLLIGQLIARFGAVQVCLLGSDMNQGERLFSGVSYLPKATVQAAIGSIPLLLGVPAGELILAIAVLDILITAPIGAIVIDQSSKKLLKRG